MQTNYDKIHALRRVITAQIVAMMKEHNLEEIELNTDDDTPEGLCDPAYVHWADNDGYWFEAPVKKVILNSDGIELYCENEHGHVIIGPLDFACQMVEWLEDIRMGIIKTLGI